MTCSRCGEKTLPGLVCCDELVNDLDTDDDGSTIIRGDD